MLVYGLSLEGAGDLVGAIAAQSESIELSEGLGAGFLVDAARVGLIGAVSQLAASGPGQLRKSAATLRTTIVDALQRHNIAFVSALLAIAVERVLWADGDYRRAAVLGGFARGSIPFGAQLASVVDTTVFDDATLAGIEAEKAELDIETAGALAVSALDRILAEPG